MEDYEVMLKIYNGNVIAAKEWEEYHNKFLSERNINNADYEKIIYNLITDSIEKTIRECKYYNYIRGH